MASGTVKWFDSEMGFGFIEQDGGGPGIFAHYSNIAATGFRELQEGQKVNFDISQGQKGPRRPTLTGPSPTTYVTPASAKPRRSLCRCASAEPTSSKRRPASVRPTSRSYPRNYLAFLGLAAALCCYKRLLKLTT